MARIDEIVSEQFRDWEERGRGWRVYGHPVVPEPPFRPFTGYRLPQIEDDGRKPTFLNSLVGSIRNALAPEIAEKAPAEDDDEAEPRALEREELVELQVLLRDSDIDPNHFVRFLEQIDICGEPIAFELLGRHDSILTQFVAHPKDAGQIERNLIAIFPEIALVRGGGRLSSAWQPAEFTGAVGFGLEEEFILPLGTEFSLDPFLGLITAMSNLAPEEFALFQVLFERANAPWASCAWDAITGESGRFLFSNHPRLNTGAKEKFNSPIYAAVVRIMAGSGDADRAWSIIRDLAFALRVFANPAGNALIPLRNDEYPVEVHAQDILLRQSRRPGMIINRDELIGLVHLPSSEIRTSKLIRQVKRSKAAPAMSINSDGLILGENEHMGTVRSVGLSPADRVRHMHLIGASGTGKSTLLLNLISQDIQNGEGVAVLDPHGDLIDRILGTIPENRIDDVVLIDPSDEEYSVGFNILSAHSDLEKNLLASDLVSVFQRLSTAWGDQLGSVLQNAILAFLESSRGGTIADVRRFLIEPGFREDFLPTVNDPDIVYYWRKGFTQLSGNKSIGPVLTRLETFLAPKPIRYMVSQTENRIDFADMLDSGKIFLAKLPQGQIGKENSFLLGSLLVSKFQQLAMGRQAQRVETRRPFYLYIDEFQNFITPSMAEILSGARKYKLGLVLAHQELRQLDRDREVASAVLGNAYTRVVFRVGDSDARVLESGFGYFEARDLQNLEIGHAICRIERADNDFNLKVPFVDERPSSEAEETRSRVIAASRKRYGTPRSEIEAAFRAKLAIETLKPKPAKKEKPDIEAVVAETLVEVPPEPVEKPTAKAEEIAPTSDEKAVAQVTEPPQPAIPTAKNTPAPAPPSTSSSEPKEVSAVGIGGEQFSLIQARIKETAKKLGYTVTNEYKLPDGRKIDLALERSDRRIAVEIAVTTTIDWEVGNVAKCLDAAFPLVAVVGTSERKLAHLKEAMIASFGDNKAARISFFLPEQFCAYLQDLSKAPVVAPPPTQKSIGKYKVKVSGAKLTEEELKAKEEAWFRTLDEGMRRKPSDEKK